MTARDSSGRFTKGVWEPGPPLFDGAAAVIRSLPEVASFAMPGEKAGLGVQAEEGHYLVEFWPILLIAPSVDQQWELLAPLLFDINRTVRPDPKTSSQASAWEDHFSHVVHFRMGKGGAQRNDGLHSYGYDDYEGGGAVCRGTASFSNDPFRATMLLRLWVVQTLENRSLGSKSRTYTQWWWKEHSEQWLQRFANPRCIVAPNIEVGAAKVIDLDPAWVKRAVIDDFKKPLPITSEEVREGKRAEVRDKDVVMARA